MGIGEKIKKLRNEKGLSQEALSKKLEKQGVHLSQEIISRIEAEARDLWRKELVVIGQILGVRTEYLEDDAKSYPPSNGDCLPKKPVPGERIIETEEAYTKRVPVRLRVAADGTPAVSYDTEGFPLGETGEYIGRPAGLSERAYAAEVSGDSLEPGLPHKARVIADPRGPVEWDKIKGGDIVIIKVISKDRTYVKRIEFNGDKVILISTYPVRHHPIETIKEDVEILHKVVWVKMP